jgi:hypothetical protein
MRADAAAVEDRSPEESTICVPSRPKNAIFGWLSLTRAHGDVATILL